SCSCLFRCLSDSIPPRSIFASLELLLPSCCCSFPFPRVHLSKSLANSRRFLLTSCLACLKLIVCCSCFFLFFLVSVFFFFLLFFIFFVLLYFFFHFVFALFHFLVFIYQTRLQILGVFF